MDRRNSIHFCEVSPWGVVCFGGGVWLLLIVWGVVARLVFSPGWGCV